MQILFILFLAAVGIQALYFLTFIIAFIKKRNKPADATIFPVSVIICAHDEEQNLTELIPLLLSQDHPQFEIIVVNDRSNDNTFDLLLEETRKDHRLRMVHVNRTPPHVNHKKYGITLGIKAAKYEWLLLTDADCRPHGTGWISSMAQYFKNNTGFVLGFSPYIKGKGVLNALIRFETLITAIQYFSFALLGNPYMGIGRNLAYRRSFFLEQKGFNQFLNVKGGDDDLFVNQHAKASNTVASLGQEAVVLSKPHTSWGDFFNQKVRHLSVGKFYKFKHKFLLGIFMSTWLLSWILGIVLLALAYPYYYIVGAWALRTLFLVITTQVSSSRLGQRFEAWAVLPLDFIYAFYYLVAGLAALVTKKVQWKT